MNILLIHSDQHRWDCLGANNANRPQTPHLDRLAKSGTNFTQAYATSPICSPARASLLTGAWPSRHGCLSIPRTETYRPADDTLPNLCHLLSEAGYYQAWVGKFHGEVKGRPEDHGVDDFVPVEDYVPWRESQGLAPMPDWTESLFGMVDDVKEEHTSLAWQADHVLQFMQNAPKDKPFFMRWDPPEPHLPCLPPKAYADLYDPADMEPWPSFPETFEGKPYAQKRQTRIWGVEGWTWEDWAPVVARYYAVITELDHHIGRVLDQLEALGLAEDTVVIYTTDHGDYCGGHGQIDKHFSMYDDLMRVPYLVRWPGKASGGSKSDAFVSNELDTAKTILAAAGIEAPEAFVGENICHLLDGKGGRPHAYAQYFGTESGCYTARMLRDKEWKYVYHPTSVDELYHLPSDPGELKNLAEHSDHADVLKRLRKALAQTMRDEGDPLINLWTEIELCGVPPIAAQRPNQNA